MKLKGINKFEQHLEKIVLGVSVLGLLAIVGWQFLSPPSFKLGSRSVPAGEVDALLEAKANALQARLSDSEWSQSKPNHNSAPRANTPQIRNHPLCSKAPPVEPPAKMAKFPTDVAARR
jgi:hypothetical protein